MTRPGLIVWFALLLAASLYYFGSRYHFAPDTQIEHLQFEDQLGRTYSIDNYKGKNTMLHFYAAWCAPCMNELPGLIAAEPLLNAMQISIVGLTDDDHAQIEQLQTKQSINFPIYKLKGSLRSNGIPSIPTTFIVNAEGEIIYSVSGPVNWSDRALLDVIQQNLQNAF